MGLFELASDRPFILDAIRRAGGDGSPALHVVSHGDLWAGVFKAQ